jgi:hypothetical protein
VRLIITRRKNQRHYVNLPTPMQETLVPVVTFHAPETEVMPSGMKKGTRLLTEVAPPVKTVIEIALSRSKTLPGEVVAGITNNPWMKSPVAPTPPRICAVAEAATVL